MPAPDRGGSVPFRRIELRGTAMTTPTAQAPAARTERLSKSYGDGPTRVTALDQVSLEIGSRSFTAIMGPSGSGKSTLMHCMAGLDRADNGQA
jgi:putative ABC transport system ATP-binding protein